MREGARDPSLEFGKKRKLVFTSEDVKLTWERKLCYVQWSSEENVTPPVFEAGNVAPARSLNECLCALVKQKEIGALHAY